MVKNTLALLCLIGLAMSLHLQVLPSTPDDDIPSPRDPVYFFSKLGQLKNLGIYGCHHIIRIQSLIRK